MRTSNATRSMGIIARAMRSTARHPLRSLLLCGLVAAIGCLLCAGSALLTASVKTQIEGQSSVPATYRLELDIGNLRDRLNALPPEYSQQVGDGAWETSVPDNAFQSILQEDVDALASVESIGRTTVEAVPVPALLVGLQRIEDPRRDQSYDIGGVNVVGMDDGTLDPNVVAGNIVLVAGDWIEPDDKDAVVVSQDLADLNGLSVGDEVVLIDALDPGEADKCTATVKGIFCVVHEMPTTMTGDTYRSENTIFSDLAFSQRVAGREDDPLYSFALFQVEDPACYQEAGEAMKSANINWERYALVDDSGTSERRAQNFDGLEGVTYLFMGVVVVCGLSLIVLSLAFWMRNRAHEVAVLISLGLPRRSPVMQIALEACALALVGCLVAALVASPIAQGLVSAAAAGQLEHTAQVEEVEASRTAGAENMARETYLAASAQITWRNIVMSTVGVELMVIVAVLGTAAPVALRRPRAILAGAE